MFQTQEAQNKDTQFYANRHVPKFLAYAPAGSSATLQVVADGSQLTAANLRNDKISPSRPILVTDTPISIGMKVPTNKKKKCFTVRDVMNVVGHHYPISVIDVAHQEELSGWTMQDLVEYFEDESRLQQLLLLSQKQDATSTQQQHPPPKRRRRAAAEQAIKLAQEQQRPKVLNQISMEFSKTPLQRMVSSPRFVRDLDWIDNVWPTHLKEKGEYPVVQYYCLTSTAGCYTDFHIDFGGTSVWYHVLNGKKSFMLIAPTDENLQKYEEWLCHANQSQLFFPDMLLESTTGVVKVTLEANQTLVIPTGWIHAVHTPVDSVVVGGNFLHGLEMELQLKVYCLETRAKVQERFRFPHFCPLMYHAGGHYLQGMQKGQICRKELEGIPSLLQALQTWWKMHSKQKDSSSGKISNMGAATHAAHHAGCDSVDQMLTSLQSEYDRIQKNGIVPNPDAAATIKSPKLRLKLKQRGNASPPPTASNDLENSAREKRDEASKFRIVIPHSSTYALATGSSKKRKSISREPVDAAGSVVDHDEEWKPSGGKKRHSKLIIPSSLVKKSSSPQRLVVSPAKKKAATTTSRQRLMKRFRS